MVKLQLSGNCIEDPVQGEGMRKAITRMAGCPVEQEGSHVVISVSNEILTQLRNSLERLGIQAVVVE